MKTVVVRNYTTQYSCDEFKMACISKVFDDNSTLHDIKEWLSKETKIGIDEINLGDYIICSFKD